MRILEQEGHADGAIVVHKDPDDWSTVGAIECKEGPTDSLAQPIASMELLAAAKILQYVDDGKPLPNTITMQGFLLIRNKYSIRVQIATTKNKPRHIIKASFCAYVTQRSRPISYLRHTCGLYQREINTLVY